MTDQDRTAADRLAQLEDRLIAVQGDEFTTTRQLVQARRLTVFAGQWTRLARAGTNETNQTKALRRAQFHLKEALNSIEEATR